MSDLAGRYPFSTADAQSIPLDIIRPEGVVIIPIAHNSPSTAFTLSTSLDCFSFHADVQCLVKFAASSAVAPSPVENVLLNDCLCVPANTVIIVSPPIDKRSVSVISTKGNGKLVIQYLQTWSGLALKNQQIRR